MNEWTRSMSCAENRRLYTISTWLTNERKVHRTGVNLQNDASQTCCRTVTLAGSCDAGLSSISAIVINFMRSNSSSCSSVFGELSLRRLSASTHTDCVRHTDCVLHTVFYSHYTMSKIFSHLPHRPVDVYICKNSFFKTSETLKSLNVRWITLKR